MRDRDRTAPGDLLLEQRHYTTIAAQHITKAHGEKACVIVLKPEDDELGHPLGHSHNIGRIDCFIRGD